ncbi:MAG: hypothetical protein F6K54_21590 [Okeania sp. SIO3B5]|uniref:hypothetical protein n=1 Tax=Okeania sp. SIO3B5 TaxID=2607811 RepID=UPI0014011661|nr:hypothetical protein [Okeania sp. SIO3B5]NEO55431.1 hypothetical protein [Okeania sp. SIO3B5]
MQTSRKRASWKIRQVNKNCYQKNQIEYLEGETNGQNQTINANNNLDRLQSDWSGYCDELDID